MNGEYAIPRLRDKACSNFDTPKSRQYFRQQDDVKEDVVKVVFTCVLGL